MKIFNVLKYLSPLHQCDLICFDAGNTAIVAQFKMALPAINDIRLVDPPAPWGGRLRALSNILFLRPPSFARFASAELRAEILDAQRRIGYDAIHFDIINMAQYYDDFQGQSRLVHSPNDATSQLYFRLGRAVIQHRLKIKFYLAAWLLRRFERKHYENFAKIHVVSEEDKKYLKQLVPRADIEVIPICSGYPYARHEVPAVLTKKTDSTVTIVVCGNLGDPWIASGFELFLLHVLPVLDTRFSKLKVLSLGRKISPKLLALVNEHLQVDHTEWVEDFDQFLCRADVVLVPDLAGAPGAKTRVVQAMALGLAVVGSNAAFEGIPIKNGVQGFTYSSQSECCEMLTRLLMSASERRRMAAAAACLAAEEYSLEQIGPRYEALYNAATSDRN